MPADEFGRYSDVGTCLYVRPTWWCVSCQPDGDGCMVETYLEFKLCPSHRSPLAPWLTPPQGSHPKNKGVRAQAETRVYAITAHQWFVWIEIKIKKAQMQIYMHTKLAQTGSLYNSGISLLLLRLDEDLLGAFGCSISMKLESNQHVPCIKVYTSARLHHHHECFD